MFKGEFQGITVFTHPSIHQTSRQPIVIQLPIYPLSKPGICAPSVTPPPSFTRGLSAICSLGSVDTATAAEGATLTALLSVLSVPIFLLSPHPSLCCCPSLLSERLTRMCPLPFSEPFKNSLVPLEEMIHPALLICQLLTFQLHHPGSHLSCSPHAALHLSPAPACVLGSLILHPLGLLCSLLEPNPPPHTAPTWLMIRSCFRKTPPKSDVCVCPAPGSLSKNTSLPVSQSFTH